MNTLRTIWKVTKLAFAPIPKVQEGVQRILLALALLGIAITPEEILSRLYLSFGGGPALLFGVLAFLFGLAAVRLQSKFDDLPITFQFEQYERFLSTIRFRSFKKKADQHFNNFKLDVKLIFRLVNNSDHAVDLKSIDLLLMKKRFLNSPKVFVDSYGSELLNDYADKKLIHMRLEPISVEAKTRGRYYSIDRDFELDTTYGLLLLDTDRYFLRLTLEAVGQPKLSMDVIPDWNAVLDEQNSKNLVKSVRS